MLGQQRAKFIHDSRHIKENCHHVLVEAQAVADIIKIEDVHGRTLFVAKVLATNEIAQM
jgi:hypothetical protein